MIRSSFAAALGAVLLCVCTARLAQADARLGEALADTGAVDTGPALSLARPDLFSSVDSATLIRGLPVLTLLDGRRFPISTELGRMGMTPFDIFPVAFLSAVEVQKPGASSLRYGSDAPGGVVNLRLNRIRTGGEVGFFYGRSDGKYGREDYAAHIIGSVGTEKFNITAGAIYHESSGHVPRARDRD